MQPSRWNNLTYRARRLSILQVTIDKMMDKVTEVDEAWVEVVTLTMEVQIMEVESSRTPKSRTNLTK